MCVIYFLCMDKLLLLLLQGLLPMTRIAYGDVANSTQQINASANLEIMLSITMHDVSGTAAVQHQCSSSSNAAV